MHRQRDDRGRSKCRREDHGTDAELQKAIGFAKHNVADQHCCPQDSEYYRGLRGANDASPNFIGTRFQPTEELRPARGGKEDLKAFG